MSSSLTQRIVGAVVALEVVCATAFSYTALWHERNTRLHAFDAMLQGRSDSVLGAVQDAEDPDDNVTVDPDELKLPKQDFYAVYNQGGKLLGGSRQLSGPLTERKGDGIRVVRVDGHGYRVLEREAMRIIDREENGGVGLRRPITIVYASPTAHVWHEVLEAARFYAIVSFVLVGATALLLVVFIRAFLKPVGELAEAASSVSAASLSFTPPRTALDMRELRPLAEAMSAVVIRLGEAFTKQHRFVGDAAHELKTAVAVVRSSVQVLMLRTRTSEEYRSGLRLILTDNERVEELVSRMLTLARFEEEPPASGKAMDLAEVTAGSLDLLNTFALAYGIHVERDLSYGVRTRIAPEAVQTLVSNLLVNAIQHSTRGASVEVKVYTAGASLQYVVLEVQDHGQGIAPADLPHVFDRFYRVDTSRSRETGGAGLGLAICKSIVEAAGGSISLESVQGRGTTARVTFISA